MPYKKVAHVTSVHSRNDSRIFFKQCRSLVLNGYLVYLLVADGKGDQCVENIRIIDNGKTVSRFRRITESSRQMLKKAIEINADLYHLHDPELIPMGLRLKTIGKKVIFDSHEDVASQLLGKPYLPPLMLKLLSFSYSIFERYALPTFDGIIAATPLIKKKISTISSRVENINNFPIVGELDLNVKWEEKRNEVCYIGGLEKNRGIYEIVKALEFLKNNTRLNLAGCFTESAFSADVRSYSGWNRVNELGFISRDQVRKILNQSLAGLVILHPLINYIEALPIKMFEYMSSGIPVIASNFPLWRNIIEDNNCGICVNPFSQKEIACAIDFIVNNSEIAQAMGENGKRQVLEKYNWSIEETKLIKFYNSFF